MKHIRAELYSHQIKAHDLAVNEFQNGKYNGYAFLMEQGTGKTLASIAVIGSLNISKVLIVSPLSIVGVWEAELNKYGAFPFCVHILTGDVKQKAKQIEKLPTTPLQIVITNYESIWREPLDKALANWEPELIILDESHKIKTHNSKASKYLHILGTKAKYRLILTGTPITNKEIDIFSQYKFLAPEIFGTRFYVFKNKYFDNTGYGGYTSVLKKSMQKNFTDKIHQIAFRITKDECLDLPETQDIEIPITLEDTAQKIYDNLRKTFIAELENGAVTTSNVLTKLLRLSQLTGGYLTSDDSEKTEQLSKAKLTALEDLIDSSSGKVVIIARFTAEIDGICKMLDKKKIKYVKIDGSVKNRAELVEQFQNDSETSVFVGQIATTSLGITLTAASTLIFYSLSYSMSDHEQARARIHRSGQKNNCTYYYLVAKNTIDEQVIKALKNKANLAKTLIDIYGGKNAD